jgi:hypothetical protein
MLAARAGSIPWGGESHMMVAGKVGGSSGAQQQEGVRRIQ